jgi:Flp pilus assembly protein TadG
MSRRERGQVLAFYAVLLPVILLPLAAYAVDIAFVITRSAGLQAATAQAAEVAAQHLDAGALRSRSVLIVDALAAPKVASQTLSVSEPEATVESVVVVGPMVTLFTHEVITLPFNFLPAQAIVIHARASARLVGGYDSPSSFLPLPTSNF